MFKVNISYEIEKSDKSRMNKNDCFVFKSKGSTVGMKETLFVLFYFSKVHAGCSLGRVS